MSESSGNKYVNVKKGVQQYLTLAVLHQKRRKQDGGEGGEEGEGREEGKEKKMKKRKRKNKRPTKKGNNSFQDFKKKIFVHPSFYPFFLFFKPTTSSTQSIF